jgi:diacylglycerol kinase (ATP)
VDIKKIFLIINPASGNDEPVTEIVNRIFGADEGLLIHVLKKHDDLSAIIHEALTKADLIAIYGGDGTVTEAAAALIGSGKPLAIIPGGTANVLSKELHIPQDTEDALILLRDRKFTLKTMDTGLVNDQPFLLRINLGIMADMITKTDPELKDNLGQLAYCISTLKSINEATPIDYRLVIDGQQINTTGVSLTITNSGSMGIGSLQLKPGISISDGLLDVILLKDTGFVSLIKAAGSTLFGNDVEEVSHWTCKEIEITLPEKQTYLCDDTEAIADKLSIKVVPSSLTVAVPLND